MMDEAKLLELLTPPEIALILAVDPTFTVPHFSAFANHRMRAAWRLLRRGQYDVAEVVREAVDVPEVKRRAA